MMNIIKLVVKNPMNHLKRPKVQWIELKISWLLQKLHKNQWNLVKPKKVITKDFKKKRNWKVNSRESKKLLPKNKMKIYYQLHLKKKLRLLFNLTVFLWVHKTKKVNRSQFRECINLSRAIAEDQVNMLTLVEFLVKMTLRVRYQESIH